MIAPSQLQELAAMVIEGLAARLKQDEDWVSPERAAQILGCKVRTLRTYVKEGKLIDNEAGRGGNTLYKLESVHACRFYKMNANKLIK